VLSGCFASSRIHLDSPAPAVPDYRTACQYAWPGVVSEFHMPIPGIANPGWAYYSQGIPWGESDEQLLDQWLTALIAEDLSSCNVDGGAVTPVELDIYYASYELPLGEKIGRTLFDLVTVIATAGSIPVDESTGYLLCLEIHSADRVVHHALVNGRIKVDMNLWGTGRLEDRAHAAVTEMMQVLGQAAWNSLWIDPAPAGTLESDCTVELAASGMVVPEMMTRKEREALEMQGPDMQAGDQTTDSTGNQ